MSSQKYEAVFSKKVAFGRNFWGSAAPRARKIKRPLWILGRNFLLTNNLMEIKCPSRPSLGSEREKIHTAKARRGEKGTGENKSEIEHAEETFLDVPRFHLFRHGRAWAVL